MFGHRWLREDEHQRLLGIIDAQEGALGDLHFKNYELMERLIAAEGTMRAAQAMRDVMVTRLNQLEEESAMLRHKLTGLPQIAPKIERGLPLRASEIGAGVDLFEDVGDEKAHELQQSGLLHETGETPAFPTAENLTRHLN